MNINLKIVVFLFSLAATAFAIILGVSIGSEDFFTPSIIAAGFGVLMFIGHPWLAAAGAVATFSSGVTLPGLPGQMKLFDAFAVLMIGICILKMAMKAGKQTRFNWLDWIVIMFALWILVVGYVRGFGFLAFGDSMIGGFLYLRLILAASLVITLPRIALPIGSWKVIFLLAGLLAPATLIADMLIVNGWAYDVVRVFVQTTADVAGQLEAGGDEASSMNRLFSAGPAANGMLISLLCLVPMRKFFKVNGIAWLIIFAAIVTLSLMSGFRLMTGMLFLMAALTLYFQKGLTAPRLVILFVAMFAGLCMVYLYSSQFPNNIQRAISWLPGIDVSSVTRGDANQTVEWRLRLWQEALRYLPDYWLIGKGFSYDELQMIAAFQAKYQDDLKWAIVMGAYHNGWLSMLLCTGVVGTVLCLTILVAPLRRHWKRQYAGWNSQLLKRFHGVFLATFASNVVVFLLLYGDVQASFPSILFQWAVLETLSLADVDAPFEREEGEGLGESTYEEA